MITDEDPTHFRANRTNQGVAASTTIDPDPPRVQFQSASTVQIATTDHIMKFQSASTGHRR